MGRVLVGTAGFSFKDWEGIVYPADLKKRKLHPLTYYAQFYDCCEINASFYGHIRANSAQQWCDLVTAVNPAFMFTAKLNKNFTHASSTTIANAVASSTNLDPELGRGRLDYTEHAAKAGLDVLGNNRCLGALLMQFPATFQNTAPNREYLARLIERFRVYPLAVEVRNESWNEPAVLRTFTEAGVAFCNIDQPNIDESLRGTTHVTAKIAYVRLYANSYSPWLGPDKDANLTDYLHTREQLLEWKRRIETIRAGAEKTFVIANNHPNGQSAANALELKSLIDGVTAAAPPSLAKAYPQLAAP